MSRSGTVAKKGSRVRLVDVAQLAGVSTTTASRALSGRGEISQQTRTAVIEVANRLGFRPSPFAQSLRTNRSHTVGLIIPHVSHPFYASIVQGAQQCLREAGYRLILIDAGEDSNGVGDAIETLLDNWVEGIMISTAPLSADEFAASLKGVPCVFIDEIIEGFHASSVAFHNRTGMAALVEHMHGHGHERIALLSGPTEQTDGRERREGFLAAMAAEGLIVTPGTIRNCDWDIRSGFNEARQLLSSANPPSAVVASSAELALGALAAAKSLGLDLPGQMALASFDDPYFAALLEPALTAIAYDAPSMGAISARLLVSTIELGVPDYRSVRIDVHLVPRRSCGCEFDVAQALTAHPL